MPMKDSIYHMLGGAVNYNIIDKVLHKIEGTVDSTTSSDLEKNWVAELKKQGALPQVLSGSNFHSNIDPSNNSNARLNEVVPGIGRIQGIEGRPEMYMSRPELHYKKKLRIDFQFTLV